LLEEYLAGHGGAPAVELSCCWLAHPQIRIVREQLHRLFTDQGDGPIIFVWIEWLRTEVLGRFSVNGNLELWSAGDSASDSKQVLENLLEVVNWVEQQETERMQKRMSTESLCANCRRKKYGCNILTCTHFLCSDCTFAVSQIHIARGDVPRCPLPNCRLPMGANIVEQVRAKPEEPWGSILSQVVNTPFLEVIVFCPQCEKRGMDMPILMFIGCSADARNSGLYSCQSQFCAVCRSPAHPGTACLSDDMRAVRMSRRKPPLLGALSIAAFEASQRVELVFCPRCEEQGTNSEACMPSIALETDFASLGAEGKFQCECFVCRMVFCGICRTPCHEGPCLAREQSVEGMVLRRPPLPEALADLARERATTLALACQGEFNAFRDAFLAHYEKLIMKGLKAALSDNIQLVSAPLANVVQRRFMTAVKNHNSTFVTPGFHGTDAKNHASIFRHGLLIPGQGNSLKVVHGEAYGRGVYTAKLNAAWLSAGFVRVRVCLYAP